MTSSWENIKKDLIGLYTDMYLISRSEAANNFFSKEILKRIRYEPEEIMNALEISDNVTERPKYKIRTEIIEIQTREQVSAYFKEYLLPICQPDIAEEKRGSILKSITMEEIRHLYKIVFDIPLTGKFNKIDIIYKLKNYFDSEERTADLTKNF